MPRQKPSTYKGSICSKGHDKGGYSLRYVHNKACVDCHKDYYRQQTLKRRLEKARKLLEAHSVDVAPQIPVEPRQTQKLFVAIVNNQQLPELLGLSAKQRNGKLTALVQKKTSNNSFAIFKFDTEENAWSFHKITKGKYLAVSEPSETTEIPVTAFR
jgi:hypothetical protein